MFGLVLSIGIVVDDAIVVVENVERHMRAGMTRARPRTSPWTRWAARSIGIALVLVAVFVPDGVHGRHRGAVLQAVRAHDRERHADLADRVAEPVAGACAR